MSVIVQQKSHLQKQSGSNMTEKETRLEVIPDAYFEGAVISFEILVGICS